MSHSIFIQNKRGLDLGRGRRLGKEEGELDFRFYCTCIIYYVNLLHSIERIKWEKSHHNELLKEQLDCKQTGIVLNQMKNLCVQFHRIFSFSKIEMVQE